MRVHQDLAHVFCILLLAECVQYQASSAVHAFFMASLCLKLARDSPRAMQMAVLLPGCGDESLIHT